MQQESTIATSLYFGYQRIYYWDIFVSYSPKSKQESTIAASL